MKLPRYEKWGGHAQYFAGNVERYYSYWAAATKPNPAERRKQAAVR